jgi:hypothetical protein
MSVEHDGVTVAALIHDAALRDEHELVRGLGAAASLALQNERLEAELEVRLEELRSSRSRRLHAGRPRSGVTIATMINQADGFIPPTSKLLAAVHRLVRR